MNLDRWGWLFFIPSLILSIPAQAGEIHRAAEAGDLAGVQKLLDAEPALIQAADDKGRTPLHLAAFNGRDDVVALLIRKGAEVDRRETHYDLTPLHMAAWKGHAGAARLLLEAGADLNARERDNETPLYYAATADSIETIDLFLARGADLNDTQSKVGNTPLSLAVERGQNGTALHLIDRGADQGLKQDHGTLLHGAAWRGSQALVGRLIAGGLDPNAANDAGITPLYLAASVGNAEAVKALLDGGARTDVRTRRGETPLWAAAARGQKETAALLLQAKADPNAGAGGSGVAPLHIAAMNGYGDIVGRLAAGGADLQARDHAGNTALDYALRYDQRTSARILEKRGARAAAPANGRDPMDDLGKKLRDGEAQVWYLNHSGWVVRTSRHLLVFDYFAPRVPPDDPSLANGVIVPRELRHENVVVLSSHAHGDHFSPSIFEWGREIPRFQVVLGFKPEGGGEYTLIEPMQRLNLDGLEITATASNDGGVAFFVRVDGVALYHAGDHANRQPEITEDFRREIDVLARNGLRPDLLFAPVTGCGLGDPESVRKGVYYTVEKLAPRAVFPMHAGGGEDRLAQFAEQAAKDGVKGKFLVPVHGGDRFLVPPEGAEKIAKR
jgi:ankyrin repeat protein/L-ascorbate metabolism protein UlaG (beta-lactamase superfamily)